MKLANPYMEQGLWLRGSFHNHTSDSDGHHPLSTIYRMYNDYDFFAVSDHNLVMRHTEESRIPNLFEAVEVSSSECHMLLVHPNRYYSQYWKLEDMLAMKSYSGIEVINGDGPPQYVFESIRTEGNTITVKLQSGEQWDRMYKVFGAFSQPLFIEEEESGNAWG